MAIRNGFVRCVGFNRRERYFTLGKVYAVVDDTIVNDNGHVYRGDNWESALDFLSSWYRFEPCNENGENVCAFCGKVTTDYVCADETIVCADCQDEHIVYCDCCGRAVLNDNTNNIGYEIICNDCVSRYYVTCSCCGELVHRDNTVWNVHDERICEDCANEYYRECYDCGSLIHVDDMVWNYEVDDYLCEYCDERRNRAIKPYNFKPLPIFYGDEKFRMGVELEVDNGGEDCNNAQILLNIMNDENEHIYIKHDGSLEYGFEIVSHPATLEYHLNNIKWEKLMEKALAMNYRSHDTDTCGLHVHVSRNALGDTYDEEEITISKILYFVENNWHELLRFTRRTERNLRQWASRYGIINNIEDTYKNAKDENSYNRYHCVNLLNEHTIEFRIFRGTLKYDTFVATLQLVYNICNICKNATMAEVEKMNWSAFVRKIDNEKYRELFDYLSIRGINV